MATGKDLDRVGELFGVERYATESDVTYRARILDAIRNPIDLTRPYVVLKTASGKASTFSPELHVIPCHDAYDIIEPLAKLARRVAALNPDGGGIGEGMLRSLIIDAQAALAKIGSN